MGQRSPLQSFELDVNKMFTVVDLIHSGVVSLQDIGQALGMGQRKVRSLREWGCMANILEGSRSTTAAYPHLRKLKETGKWLQVLQLAYYWLCRNNSFMGYIVHRYGEQGEFTVEQLKRDLIESDVSSGKSEKSVRRGINVTLNSLTNTKGLGDLELFRKVTRGRTWYSACSRCPDLLIVAYIIYTNWPSHTAKVAISEIVAGRNSVGRIFFLTEFQVMSILRELEDQGLIKIETAAGLDQIGRDPRITSDNILEMIIAEA
jgi:hypothetical protein